MKEKILKRQQRIRRKITGTSERPRVTVFRSNTNLYLQAIDDGKGITIAATSTLKDKDKMTENFVAKLKAKKIKKVVFDRRGYQYHGKVKKVAEDLRKLGLEF